MKAQELCKLEIKNMGFEISTTLMSLNTQTHAFHLPLTHSLTPVFSGSMFVIARYISNINVNVIAWFLILGPYGFFG